MSSSDAQRSPVHQSTEDSSLEPSGPATPPADAPRRGIDRKVRPDDAAGPAGNFERGAATAGVRPDTDADANPPGAGPLIGGGPGASDASSGAGAGAGIPGGGTDMRTDGAFSGGNPDEDRKRLFPDSSNQPGQDHARDDRASTDPDESSFGGPLKLDDPDAV